MEEPGRLQSMGSLRVWHDWATSLSLSCIGERNGNPLQCSCLENPRDSGPPSMGSHRVGHDWSDLAATFHFAYTLHLLNHPSINGHLDCFYGFNSVQFSHSVMSDSLQHHEPQHSRPTIHHQLLESTQTHVHRVSDAISSSVIPFSSCPQSFPASGTFQMSQLFASVGQSIGVSALASFLPKKSQGWSPSEWTGWISLQLKGLSRVFSNTTVPKHQFFSAQLSL